MTASPPLRLSARTVEAIARHAVASFPEECCGVVFSDGSVERTHPLTNIQNKLHALDPQTFPRTATIAYAMDPKELEIAMGEAETAGARLKAFYHSHPNHDAYFSEEDKAFACPFGEPNFPGVAQIVVSIYDGAVKRVRAYAWSEEAKDFVEVAVEKA